MTTSLEVTLSAGLQSELSKPGAWAYAVYFNGTDPAAWTSLVNNGAVVPPAGSVGIALPATFNGGKVYFLVQSQDRSQPNNLQTLITQESDINWGNAAAWGVRYDSFEVTLEDSPGDAGNLTSVEGFGLPMDLRITYADGTTSSRGYGLSGAELFQQIAAINAGRPLVETYASGPLAGKDRAGISPSQAVGLAPPNPAFSPDDWNAYIASLEQAAPAAPISISGFFNGAADANRIYHNSGYFSYTLEWDATNAVFWLAPGATSQIQGYIKLTPADLANSIYETLGDVEIYTSKSDATPYQILGNASAEMNTGANNQWGAVLAQFLTGFTAGYYNVEGQAANSLLTAPINLNANINWDPTYAFGRSLAGSGPLNYDPYSKIFFLNSNSYGSGYSDNLMSQYSVGGPLISVWDPTRPSATSGGAPGGNVQTINLTLYADNETPAGYTRPVIYNTIDPGSAGYAQPVANAAGNSLVLSFANKTSILADQTPITLRFYAGEAVGVPVWQEATLNAPAGTSLWQGWNLAFANGAWTATPTGSFQPAGSILLTNVPSAQSGVSWYQIAVGGGASAKAFNFYATTDNYAFLNPGFAGQAGALAVDGLAFISLPASATPTIPTLSLSFLYSTTTTLDPALLVQNTNAAFLATLPTPNAPVAGTLAGAGAGAGFTAIAGQSAQVTNSVTVADAEVAFGWTGLNSAGGMPSWISGYTNKTGALNLAQIRVAEVGGTYAGAPITAVGDIDGQWQTPAGQFGNGTYAITMQEVRPAAPTTPVAPQSAALTLTVAVAEVGLRTTGEGIELAAGGAAGNWVRFDVLPSALVDGMAVHVYAVDGAGRRIGRDGATTGVTLADATFGTIGHVRADDGAQIALGVQSVYLPAGAQLRFATVTGDGVIDTAPTMIATPQGDGSVRLAVAGLEMTAVTDNSLTNPAEMAGSQRMTSHPFVYLHAGATVAVEAAGSTANTNQLGFVRIDIDAVTEAWSVAGVAYGATLAFSTAVRANLDTGFALRAGGDFDTANVWTLAGISGYYAPVLLTALGETFVIGDANPGGRQQIRTYGENTFGFEDLAFSQGADFDYNDMVMRVIPPPDVL